MPSAFVLSLSLSLFQIQEDEDDEVEVLLTYNCSTHLQKLTSNAVHSSVTEWNTVPKNIICAFPYILSITSDGIEFRSAVNGSLLQTITLPELRLITSKDDIFLASSRPPASARRRTGLPKDQDYNSIYKISWILLVGGGHTCGHVTSASGSTPASCGRDHHFLRKRASSLGKQPRQFITASKLFGQRVAQKSCERKQIAMDQV